MVPGERVELNESKEVEFVKEFGDKIRDALTYRARLEEKWKKWYDAYEGTVPAIKTFPWEGASNIWVPLTATNIDAITARIVGTIYGQDPLWTLGTENPDLQDMKVDLGDFLEWAVKNEIDLYSIFRNWVFNAVKLGTGIIKPLWWTKERKVFSHAAPTGRTPLPEVAPVGTMETIYNAPKVFLIDLEDFVISDPSTTIDDAEYVGHRLRLRKGALQERVARGDYDEDKVEKILSFYEVTPQAGKQEKEEAEGIDRRVEEYELYETWLYRDFDGDGREESCVATIHLDSNTVLRAEYNPRYNGKRPFIVTRLIERPNRFYGIGIAEMIATLQIAINTIHNQRIDNATLANTRGFKEKIGSGIKSTQKIYPGVRIKMNNPDDLVEFKMGDIYQSDFANESVLRDAIERRTGVSDFTLGRESSVAGARGTTATGTLAIIQEGNKRLDLFIRDVRKAMSELGAQVIELYQQYCPTKRPYFVMGERGEAVEKIFQFPRDFIRSRFSFNITATTATINREVEKQTNMALFNLMLGYYDRLAQTARVLLDPRVPQELRAVIAKLSEAGLDLARKLVESFGFKDVEAILPALEEIGIGERKAMEFSGISAAARGEGEVPTPTGAEEELGGETPELKF